MPETEGTIDVEAIAARHVRVRDGTFCLCGSYFPCDAIRLLAYVRGAWGTSSMTRWRGLCGHEWRIKPGIVSPCPVCAVERAATILTVAVFELGHTG